MPVNQDLWYPPNESKYVQVLRFLNLLDDELNVLSPSKFNTWASNLGAVSTMVVTVFAWIGNHMSGIETMWAASVGWMTQAHTSRLFVKKESNKVDLQHKELDHANELQHKELDLTKG